MAAYQSFHSSKKNSGCQLEPINDPLPAILCGNLAIHLFLPFVMK